MNGPTKVPPIMDKGVQHAATRTAWSSYTKHNEIPDIHFLPRTELQCASSFATDLVRFKFFVRHRRSDGCTGSGREVADTIDFRGTPFYTPT